VWVIDLSKATERLFTALKNNEKIAIFGDYDVDGATSTALLFRALTHHAQQLATAAATAASTASPTSGSGAAAEGSEILVYIPDRIIEGYGPTTAAFEKLREMGASLIVTLDCGTSSPDVVRAGKQMGLDIIVLDHHLSGWYTPPLHRQIVCMLLICWGCSTR
jgi:single-stranded-DNA-specific exonuclease